MVVPVLLQSIKLARVECLCLDLLDEGRGLAPADMGQAFHTPLHQHACHQLDFDVQVHLIDFAHTFPTGGKKDKNFLTGLDSMLAILKAHFDS